MKSIAMFNNKGGVGKTTLLCNLAAFLAIHRRRKVLVVDADPQCNATQSLFPEPELSDFYNKNHFTINNVIRPLASGRGFSDNVQTVRSNRFAVDVLLGHPSMSLNEDLLASDWISATSGNLRGLRTTFLFAELLTKCSSYDYVFFDVGPSLGSLNRSVLIAVDSFLAPMSIDIFSLKALDNISVQLKDWKKKLERGLEDCDEIAEIGVPNPTWHLDFTGYVTQQYKAKTIAGVKQPVIAYEKIMKKVPGAIQNRIIDSLGLQGTSEEKELGSVPLLHSLIPISQNARAPIFDLGSSDGIRGSHFSRVKDFYSVIESIADNFEREVGEFI